MTSSNLALDSQHGEIAAFKPFPFLVLPAKIRNKVYFFVTLGRIPIVRLRNVSSGTDSISLFGLANANKQLRVDFLPLLMSNIEITVQLSDYPAFLTTFYGPGFEFPRPIRVRIAANAGGAGHLTSWDVMPLILAKATAPGLRLMVRELPDRAASSWLLEYERTKNSYTHTLAWRIGGRIEYNPFRYELYGTSRVALIRDVRSGYVSEIRFRYICNKKPAWSLVVRKMAGGLGDGEVKKVLLHCRTLRNGMLGWNRIFSTVTIKVMDLKGNHVEEWFSPAWMHGNESIHKKVGKEWMKTMPGA
jgi:hypothetical protein